MDRHKILSTRWLKCAPPIQMKRNPVRQHTAVVIQWPICGLHYRFQFSRQEKAKEGAYFSEECGTKRDQAAKLPLLKLCIIILSWNICFTWKQSQARQIMTWFVQLCLALQSLAQLSERRLRSVAASEVYPLRESSASRPEDFQPFSHGRCCNSQNQQLGIGHCKFDSELMVPAPCQFTI